MEFNKISETIVKRLSKYKEEKNLITEDCIRYDIYSSVMENSCSESFILEYPHDYYIGKELDLVIDDNNNKRDVFEIKYYRQIPSKKEDRTGRMAKIIVDIVKLYKSKIGQDKYFILLSDEVMLNYLRNNGYSYMLNTKGKFKIKFPEKHMNGNHFSEKIKSNLGINMDELQNYNIDLELVYHSQLILGHDIYVFKVA